MMFKASARAWFTSLPPSLVESGIPQRPAKGSGIDAPGASGPLIATPLRVSTTRQGGTGTKTNSSGCPGACLAVARQRTTRIDRRVSVPWLLSPPTDSASNTTPASSRTHRTLRKLRPRSPRRCCPPVRRGLPSSPGGWPPAHRCMRRCRRRRCRWNPGGWCHSQPSPPERSCRPRCPLDRAPRSSPRGAMCDDRPIRTSARC